VPKKLARANTLRCAEGRTGLWTENDLSPLRWRFHIPGGAHGNLREQQPQFCRIGNSYINNGIFAAAENHLDFKLRGRKKLGVQKGELELVFKFGHTGFNYDAAGHNNSGLPRLSTPPFSPGASQQKKWEKRRRRQRTTGTPADRVVPV